MWGPGLRSFSGAQTDHSCQKWEGCWKRLQKHWEDKWSGNKINILYGWKATAWEEAGEGAALRNEAMVMEALDESSHFTAFSSMLGCAKSLISISLFSGDVQLPMTPLREPALLLDLSCQKSQGVYWSCTPLFSSMSFYSIPSHTSETLAIMGPDSKNIQGSAEDFSLVPLLAAQHSHSRYSTVGRLEIWCPMLHWTWNMRYSMCENPLE